MGLYFIISWIPLSLWELILWRGFTKEYVTMQDYLDPPISINFFYAALFLAMGNSAVNPIIFGAGNMSIRRSLKHLMKCRRHHGESSVIHSVTGTHTHPHSLQMSIFKRSPTEASTMRQLLGSSRKQARSAHAQLVTPGIIAAIATTTIHQDASPVKYEQAKTPPRSSAISESDRHTSECDTATTVTSANQHDMTSYT